MKQIALDVGLASSPTFANYFAGPNEAAFKHLELWAGSTLRSPVPTYLWGETGSGKTHLLHAAVHALQQLGAKVGWMDASTPEPSEFDAAWSAVVLDECHLYTAVQQQAAFNWFVNATSSADGLPRCVLAAGNLPPADLALREDLRIEADARGVFLSDEVMDFMLRRFSRDLSSLMELLKQLDGYALQTKRAITVPLIKAMLDSE